MKEKAKLVIAGFAKLSLFKKACLIVILIAFLGFGAFKVFSNQSDKPQYQTVQAENGTLISSVTASGTISSASSASITSSATGIVKDVYVTNGDVVEEGDKIAEIALDKSSQQKATAAYANYLSAQNALNAANAKMNSLQSALFTANQKFVNGAGTADPIKDDPNYIIQKADWQQAEADYKNQQGVIAQAQAALSSTSLSYSQTSGTVTAPMSGKISNLTLTPGLSIAGNSSTDSSSDTSDSTSSSNASSSQSFGTIVLENGQTQAAVNLSEIDITKVQVGQKVNITMDAFPDKSFTGKVSAINTSGSVSSGVTSYPVTIVFDSSLPNIYPNMAVSAAIITNIKNNVLLVPSSAVQISNGESTVQVMRNGKVSQVTVEVGDSNDTQTEIVSGIREGDTVVTSTVTGGTSQTGQSTGTSPFGNTGFGGGNRGFGGAGFGGGAVRIQTR